MGGEALKIGDGGDTGVPVGSDGNVGALDGGVFAGADVRAFDSAGRVVSLPEGDCASARVVGLYVKSLADRTSVPESESSKVVARAIRAISDFVKMGVSKLVLKDVVSGESFSVQL